MERVDIEQVSDLLGAMKSDDLDFSASHVSERRKKRTLITVGSLLTVTFIVTGALFLKRSKTTKK